MEFVSGPTTFQSALLLILSLAAALFAHLLFGHVLRKLVGRTKTQLDDDLINIIRNPIFWSIILSGFYVASLPYGLSEGSRELLWRVLLTVGLGLWGWAGVRVSRVVFEELRRKARRDEARDDFVPFLHNLVKIVVLGAAFLAVLSLWGIDVTPALASAGVLGIAVAFAARDTVANLFGGVSVFFDKPYKIGDYVILKDQYRGEVVQIGMRSTKIRTRDNVLLTVPNQVMVTDAVINETGFDPKLRIRIPVGVTYGSDLEKVENVLVRLTKRHKGVLESPVPRVRYRNFGDSAIELEIMATIKEPSQRGKIIHELIKEVNKRFKEEGITIPFPQRDVHLYRA